MKIDLLLIFKSPCRMGKPCTGLRIRQGSGVRGGRPCLITGSYRSYASYVSVDVRAVPVEPAPALPFSRTFAAHSRFHARSDFISSVFSEDAVHVIRCNFQTPGFFSQGSVCLFPLRDFFGQFFFSVFSRIFSDGSFPSFFFPEIFHGFCIGVQFLGMLCTEFFLKKCLRKLLLDLFCRKVLSRIMNLLIGFDSSSSVCDSRSYAACALACAVLHRSFSSVRSLMLFSCTHTSVSAIFCKLLILTFSA